MLTIKRIFALIFAVLILVTNAVAIPSVVISSDSVMKRTEMKSALATLTAGSVFDTSMQAYLNLESLISISVCYKFNEMSSINPRDFVDKVGLLVWDAEKTPAEDEATYENCSYIIEGAYYNSVLGRFETETKGIVAKKLGDGLTFRAYYHDGYGNYEYSRLIENYSPKTYCYRLIEKNPDDEKKVKLAKSILNYGAAAQEYFDYKTDDLINKDLTEKEEESEILTFSLLDDGTYGVMAGPDAVTQATIIIPETYNGFAVTQILSSGFKDLAALQSVTIPDSVTEIGAEAFSGCIGLKNITLPSELQTINQYAFHGCSLITEITIPGKTTYIGKYAFYGTGLKKAIFEELKYMYGGDWKMENNVRPKSVYGELSSINIGYNTDNGSNGAYMTAVDISDDSVAASCLTNETTITIINRKWNLTHETTAVFYSENWIKQ